MALDEAATLLALADQKISIPPLAYASVLPPLLLVPVTNAS